MPGICRLMPLMSRRWFLCSEWMSFWPNLQSLLLLCKASCKEEYLARDGQVPSISFPEHYLVLISVCILDIVSTRCIGERTGNSPACTDKYIFILQCCKISMKQDTPACLIG